MPIKLLKILHKFNFLILCSLAMFHSTFTFANPEKQKMQVTSVYSHTVGIHQVSQSLSLVGKLQADQSVDIATEVSGKIVFITKQENKQVKRGDLLVKIDDKKSVALLLEASAYLKDEQRKLHELRQLVSKGAVTQTAVEGQQALVDIAKARHELAKVEHEQHSIRAPFSGKIGLIDFSQGKLVQVGERLLSLDKLSMMRLDLQVPERYLSQLLKGLKVRIKTAAWEDDVFSGEVVEINSRINPETLNLRVRVSFKNKNKKLKPGMLVLGTIDFPSIEELIIPVQALEYSGTKRFVYVIVNNKVKRTEVTLGDRIKNQVLIMKGLKAGDQIVEQGLVNMRDGINVQAINKSDVKKSDAGTL